MYLVRNTPSIFSPEFPLKPKNPKPLLLVSPAKENLWLAGVGGHSSRLKKLKLLKSVDLQKYK